MSLVRVVRKVCSISKNSHLLILGGVPLQSYGRDGRTAGQVVSSHREGCIQLRLALKHEPKQIYQTSFTHNDFNLPSYLPCFLSFYHRAFCLVHATNRTFGRTDDTMRDVIAIGQWLAVADMPRTDSGWWIAFIKRVILSVYIKSLYSTAQNQDVKSIPWKRLTTYRLLNMLTLRISLDTCGSGALLAQILKDQYSVLKAP